MAGVDPQQQGGGELVKITPEVAVSLLQRIDLRREQRRSYEWKVTLGLWAGLLAAAKVLVDAELGVRLSRSQRGEAVLAAIMALAVVLMAHIYFEFMVIRRGHVDDVRQAKELEAREFSSVMPPAARNARVPTGATAAALFEVTVTGVLIGVVLLVLLASLF